MNQPASISYEGDDSCTFHKTGLFSWDYYAHDGGTYTVTWRDNSFNGIQSSLTGPLGRSSMDFPVLAATDGYKEQFSGKAICENDLAAKKFAARSAAEAYAARKIEDRDGAASASLRPTPLALSILSSGSATIIGGALGECEGFYDGAVTLPTVYNFQINEDWLRLDMLTVTGVFHCVG